MYRSIGTLGSFLADTLIPDGFIAPADLGGFLGGIHVMDYSTARRGDTLESTIWLGVEGEISCGFLGIPGARLVVGYPTNGVTFITATLIRRGDPFSIKLHDFHFGVRFNADAVGMQSRASEIHFFGNMELGADLSITATDAILYGDLRGIVEPNEVIRVGGFHLSRDSFALRWREADINKWLSRVTSDLKDKATPVESDLTLRVVFGNPIREIRLDWAIQGAGRPFDLPGLTLATPDNAQFSLLFGGEGRRLAQVLLGVTFAPNTSLTAESAFAWERGQEREVHRDEDRADPLFTLKLTAQNGLSMAVLDFALDEARLPRLFRQIQTPIAPLDFTVPTGLGAPTPLVLQSLDPASWAFEFKLNLEAAPFKMPFLQSGVGNQFIQVGPVDLSQIAIDPLTHTVRVPVGVKIFFGPFDLATDVEFILDWETFAFRVDHDEGIKIYAPAPVIEPAQEFLGLHWRFRGKTPAENGRYHYFTLATKDSNYQLLQAPGASFEIEFTELSKEAIGFAINNFALTSEGVSLTATVIDRPVTLNSIDTRFRFSGTRVVIVENKITDFTLNGSGPLPPALVGDATVDIMLQLAQRNEKLTLVAGAAQLKGSKLLDCGGTRFQFTIDAIGLKFVYEGRFHLYFTLTGSARFNPRAGDDVEGPLAFLPAIQLELVECPLTGDTRVLAKHIKFLIDLPKPRSFNFLGAFEMELRGIGFVPQAEVFDGDGAMLLSGQIKFAQGAGDSADSRVDFHKLYVGLPKEGSFLPRVHFKQLVVALQFGSAFRLNGVVDYVESALEKGFTGDGSLAIQGLPTISASFAFLRARRDEQSPWVRAWFIYAEARKISLKIPVVSVYLREVGLGFGYRYTLVAIRAADQANDARQLLKELTVLSRTQGDLSKRDRWALDLEDAGEDPRWTAAFRAMFSQTSASASPLQYNENREKDLSSLFLLDAVVALRSDLTFLMSARGWLFANYYDYVSDYKGLRAKPVFSGFVLLAPRKKRFLAHVSSNPNRQFGAHPQIPKLMERALESAHFSATLLMEPGLLHFELGWPNQLRWSDKIGPLRADFRGGFIFRVSRDELVTGVSFLARSQLSIEAGVSLGVVGVTVRAEANVAFGARFIGLISFRDPLGRSAIYGAIGLEVMIKFSIELWIRFRIFGRKIQKTWRFSLKLEFTAGLEIGIAGASPGLRGRGHLAISAMGRRFKVSVKLGLNEGAVKTALDRTKHVLNLGLEASDVEAVPGLTGTSVPAPRAIAPASIAASVPAFQTPGYNVFVIRGATSADPSYFVLLPAGERANGEEEPGFLPVPPQDGLNVVADYRVQVPAGGAYTLEQYDPLAAGGAGAWVSRAAAPDGTRAFSWAAKWDAPIVTAEKHEFDGQGQPVDEPPSSQTLALREYLRSAFITTETEVPDGDPILTPVRDPFVLPAAETVEDGRVHNPTDAAFEAAVRGAVEQFRGAPYFRRDPASEYEQLLDRAYRDETTIYAESGEVPESGAELEAVQIEQQAHELRGMVAHDLVSDLRDYAQAARGAPVAPAAPTDSIAFSMGLVFRVTGTAPAWLNDAVATGAPTLSQRLAPDAAEPSADVGSIRTFNIRAADFAANPPRFERVQQLTDAATIAIAWDLVWADAPTGELTPAQRDPEHHLLHYLVRRRPLDGNEKEEVYTVKGADTLHREAGGILKQLRRRFQLVDHFTEETPEDLASLPASGKSYLYSITPIDFAGNVGRPLSVVATRFPTDPPAVPVDGELIVHYGVNAATLAPASAVPPTAEPELVMPRALSARWTEASPKNGPAIPIGDYQLVFRRESTLPIGSYGLDSTTQRSTAKSLPTTNARPLPTDVKVVIYPQGPSDARVAEVSIADLQAAGVLPAGGTAPRWKPHSWRVFFQTISLNGVPSSLAPVSVLLRVEADGVSFDPLDPPSDRREERRPAELEWLPRPLSFPILPPEDELATVGPAHVPMPSLGAAGADSLVFDAALSNVAHQLHPSGARCVRFRWNQGPSATNDYPLDLNAGYHLLELDADAHTTETFSSPDRLAGALRSIQEVQMIPADELALTPGDTLEPSLWEAWYPSSVLRRRAPDERAEGSEISSSPWYSWRESVLEWPAWPGLTASGEPGVRDGAHHPVLRAVLEALSQTYEVEVQASPAIQAQSFAAFLKSTAPASDPYGWGVLQRFGLSITFQLRTLATREIVTGAALLEAIDGALPASAFVSKHLHVELLFQPGRAIQLEQRGAEAGALVALAQLSLRPAFQQVRSYGRVSIEGRPGESVEVQISVAAGGSCTFVDQSDVAGGEIELSAPAANATSVRRAIRLPIGGRSTLLFRGAALPTVALINEDDSTTPLAVQPFEATDEHATYFTRGPAALAADFSGATAAGLAWTAFRRYAESLSSTDPSVADEEKIFVPSTRDEIEPIVLDYASWAQRFFDHGGGVKTSARPWVAVAYPRSGSPALAAPDASGRLTYDHLLEDPWAHVYRYYIRPYGRYDLLWQGLRQSPVLFPGTGRLAEAMPNPAAGGLDVVLDRTRPIAKPLVLSSSRLDAPSTEASPSAPGATWEVIVAEHPEQTLIAHNQTLARQLSFRQVAHTLLREFAYPSWLDHLGVAIELSEERYPLPPASMPSLPERLDFSAPLADVDARTLDLPARIGNFQQGALAVQWEGLPFYYEHRLLLVAQTTKTVSPINEVIQRDFEYRSPDPIAEIEPAIFDWSSANGTATVHGRRLHLTLRQLWDSMPSVAQARWPRERPDGTRRTPGWVPDLAVVYQLVELFTGNVEVQAEIYFDEDSGRFVRRQLGKRFLAEVQTLTAPAGGGTYALAVAIQQVSEQELSRDYTASELASLDTSTRSKVSVAGRLLSFTGVMSHADRDRLLAVFDAVDAPAIRAIHDGWYAEVATSAAPSSIPAVLRDVLDQPALTETRLVWDGAMSEAARTALLALPGDDELKAAFVRLASAVGTSTGVTSIAAPLGPEHVPAGLQARVTLPIDTTTGAYTALRWSGNMSDVDAAALTVWPQVRALADAVRALIGNADETAYTVALTPPRPIAEELPAMLEGRFELGETQLGWIGPAPTDGERAFLQAVLGDAAFVAARADLFAAIDAERTATLGPVVQRPSQANVPATLSQLQIGASSLAWTLPAPTAPQRTELLALVGDRAFVEAIEALLGVLDAASGNTVPLAAFVPRPAQGDLPAILQARLVIGANTLVWTSPAPTDDERIELEALVADDALIDARDLLLQEIDADRSVAIAPAVRRPRQADLPDWLEGQFLVEPTALTWRGRLHDPQWRAYLETLQGDAPFVAAGLQLLQQIDSATISTPFTIQARPAADALGILTDNLIIGRATLRFHGLMAHAELAAIQGLFARSVDARAVARLYQATSASGMRGRELRIRARRGAAPPSALLPIPSRSI